MLFTKHGDRALWCTRCLHDGPTELAVAHGTFQGGSLHHPMRRTGNIVHKTQL